MRDLPSPPSQNELLKLYNQLQNPEAQLNEKFYVQTALRTRFDPRLGEIFIARMAADWKNLNPLLLRKLNLGSVWPQCLAVLLEHVEIYLKANKLADQKLFQHFLNLITEGLKPLSYQSYSVGLYALGGKLLKEKSLRPHPLFLKWGFYETDLFLQTKAADAPTTLDIKTRKKILKELLVARRNIKVQDYIQACRGAIHKRQAERDLRSFFKLKVYGNTRGRYYSL